MSIHENESTYLSKLFGTNDLKRYYYDWLMVHKRFHRKRRFKRGKGRMVTKLIGNKFHKSHYAYHVMYANIDFQGTNVGGGAVNGSFLINYPSYARNPSGAVTTLPGIFSQFTRIFNTYDEYLVTGLRVTFQSPMTQLTPTDVVAPVGNANYPFLHLGIDLDDSASPASVAKMESLLKYKRVNLFDGKPHSIYMRQYDLVSKTQWLNTSASDPNNVPVATATISGAIPKRGTIKYYLENAINTEWFMKCKVEWIVQLRGLNVVVNPE